MTDVATFEEAEHVVALAPPMKRDGAVQAVLVGLAARDATLTLIAQTAALTAFAAGTLSVLAAYDMSAGKRERAFAMLRLACAAATAESVNEMIHPVVWRPFVKGRVAREAIEILRTSPPVDAFQRLIEALRAASEGRGDTLTSPVTPGRQETRRRQT